MSNTSDHDPYLALRRPDYQLFASGLFIATIGGQMLIFTALYEVYLLSNSARSLAWVGLALAVPMLLLTLPAGYLADHFSRRRIVVIAYLLCAVACLGMTYVSHFLSGWTHAVGAMYALLAIGDAGATLGRPSRTALLPQLVSPEVFPNAVTWNSSIFETATVLGPAVAGFICIQSISLSYAIATGCFVASAVTVWFLPETHVANSNSGGSSTGLADLLVGLKFVWNTKLMLGVMTLDLFAVLLGGATFLLPIFAKDILHVGPVGLSWLRAATSIGAISMAIIQAHRPPIKRAGRALLLAVAGFGVCTVVFGLSRNYWLSMAMLVLIGAMDNISVVVRHTIVQMLTPDTMRGRVSAVNQIFIGSSNEIGGMESGLTAEWFGAVKSVVGGGIGSIIVVAVVGVLFPQIRRLGSLKDIKIEPPPVDPAGFEVFPNRVE